MASSYDPNVIIKAADAKLQEGDIDGGQLLFQSALFNWQDDFRFGDAGSGVDRDQLQEAVATLWISYAHYLQQAKRFKSATEAYEEALKCPVAGGSGRVWLDYVRWLEDRKKLRSAQSIYLRALVDDDTNGGTTPVHPDGGRVIDEQDRTLLWNEFLEMMRTVNSRPDLNLGALQKAVREEHHSKKNRPEAITSNVGSQESIVDAKSDDDADLDDDSNDDGGDLDNRPRPAKKKARWGRVEATTDSPPSRTHVVLPEQVNEEEVALQEIIGLVEDDPQFKAMWMVRDGDEPPQAPDPPLFEAAPPKLSDPTGKDLLGVDLALSLVTRLLEPSGDAILDVARGMWTLTALEEKQAEAVLEDFEDTVLKESRALQERHKVQLSVAGAAEGAIRTMHETEQQSFEGNCQQRRQKIVEESAWKFRELLWIQQQFFTKLKLPGFVGTTVDAADLAFQARVCSYLHSAFFLRKRIGEKAHVKMLETQKKRLEDMQNGISSPPRGPLNNAVGRLSPPPMNLQGLAASSNNNMATNPYVQQQAGMAGVMPQQQYYQGAAVGVYPPQQASLQYPYHIANQQQQPYQLQQQQHQQQQQQQPPTNQNYPHQQNYQY